LNLRPHNQAEVTVAVPEGPQNYYQDLEADRQFHDEQASNLARTRTRVNTPPTLYQVQEAEKNLRYQEHLQKIEDELRKRIANERALKRELDFERKKFVARLIDVAFGYTRVPDTRMSLAIKSEFPVGFDNREKLINVRGHTILNLLQALFPFKSNKITLDGEYSPVFNGSVYSHGGDYIVTLQDTMMTIRKYNSSQNFRVSIDLTIFDGNRVFDYKVDKSRLNEMSFKFEDL
jgi:hypothetical protein